MLAILLTLTISVQNAERAKRIQSYTATGCEMCLNLIDMIEDLLKDKKTIEEIIQYSLQLCQILPDPLKATCEPFVKQYVPLIISEIEKGLETMDICTKLGFCVPEKYARALTKRAKVEEGPICDLCHTACNFIEGFLLDVRTEKEIVEFVKKFCLLLPTSIEPTCTNLIVSYVPLIIRWIEEGMEALEICMRLGLCENPQLAQKPRPRSQVKFV